MTSCDIHKSGHSLVGTWDVPADTVLNAEMMTLWFRKYGESETFPTLTYVLHPNGLLEIKWAHDRAVGGYGGVEQLANDRVRKVLLTKEDGAEIRRLLAQLRPEHLSEDFPFILPEGCGYIFDGGAWSGVSFEKGERGGAFVFQNGCESFASRKIERHLRVIVRKLPPDEGRETFFNR